MSRNFGWKQIWTLWQPAQRNQAKEYKALNTVTKNILYIFLITPNFIWCGEHYPSGCPSETKQTLKVSGRCCLRPVCWQVLSVRSFLFFNHEKLADHGINTYSVLDVWSHSQRWRPSGRRATRWKCRRSGSCVSPRSSPPRGNDGRIALKEKYAKGELTINSKRNHWHFKLEK